MKVFQIVREFCCTDQNCVLLASQEAIKKFLKFDTNNDPSEQQQAITFFNSEIDQLLDLQLIGRFPQKLQETGNCTWLAAIQTFRVALISCFLKDGKSLDEAFALGNKAFKTWASFDRILAS